MSISVEEALAYLEAKGEREKAGFAFVVWREGARVRWSTTFEDEALEFAQRVGGHAFLQRWSARYVPLGKETREEA